ncbi:MAG: hypothetical protein HY747_12050 [Elusimicrobia bacterium]|nr:hypothetical protein [Elusimicrobiota bacterium]
MIANAKEPFRFFTRLTLTVMTGIKAGNLKEFVECLKTVPESVIYQHTHRFLQQHQYLVPEPPNDFAYWVTNILQEERLGEKLAAIDTVRFHNLEDLRKRIVDTIEGHLEDNNDIRQISKGKEFYFMRAARFSVPTPHLARNLAEFRDCLQKVSISSLYLHIFEARLRLPSGLNDFSFWFESKVGEKSLAKSVANLDPYTHTLEGLRSKILSLLDARLKEPSHGAS